MNAMSKSDIDTVIDKAFQNSFSEFDQKLLRDLHPDIFKDEYAWIHVKNAIMSNNEMIKNAIKESLRNLLTDN
ncbi:MAG: hypothetical protein IIZ29_04145 [Schwartzia sp.]|nr:hypothetical protein [Schwartzia sp. (in: firmicutes)]